ncbi:hypothetical protein Tco_0465777 [Tanacetum coccineum]
MLVPLKKRDLKERYDELSKANTHSRTAYTEKLSALTSENTKLKALVHGKTSSGPSTSEKPKVLASGMYTNSSKYIPPPKRANWVKRRTVADSIAEEIDDVPTAITRFKNNCSNIPSGVHVREVILWKCLRKEMLYHQGILMNAHGPGLDCRP